LLRADIEGRETVVSFHSFMAPPRSIQVDPNGWWLLKARVGDGG